MERNKKWEIFYGKNDCNLVVEFSRTSTVEELNLKSSRIVMEIDVTWVFLAKRYTLLQLSQINMFCRSLTESLDSYYWEIRLVASIYQLFYTCLGEVDVGTRAFTSVYYGNSLCPWELGPYPSPDVLGWFRISDYRAPRGVSNGASLYLFHA